MIPERNVFHEIAASIIGLRGSYNHFSIKNEGEKNRAVAKTLATACAAGLIGSVMGFSGTIAFLVTGPLAFSHYAQEEYPSPHSIFNILGDSMVDTLTLTSFRHFSALSKASQSLMPDSLMQVFSLK